MSKYSDEINSVLHEVLEDDNTETGGISFVGETVYDFLQEIDEDCIPTTIDELDEILKECGIRPLTRYMLYCVESETGEETYGEFPDEMVNSCINLGQDCDLYEFESDFPMDDYSDEELAELEWEYLESYHA